MNPESHAKDLDFMFWGWKPTEASGQKSIIRSVFEEDPFVGEQMIPGDNPGSVVMACNEQVQSWMERSLKDKAINSKRDKGLWGCGGQKMYQKVWILKSICHSLDPSPSLC